MASMDDLPRISSQEATDVQEIFHSVAALVRSAPADDVRDSDKLSLYGLYKVATEGPCSSTSIPSVLNIVARSKHKAWKECSHLSKDIAMTEYIKAVATRQDKLGQQCQVILASVSTAKKEPFIPLDGLSDFAEKDFSEKESTEKLPEPVELDHGQSCRPPFGLFSFAYDVIADLLIRLCKHIGIRPIIPRGRLDISYQDIFFTMLQCCCWWRHTEYHCRKRSCEIRDLWGEEGIVTGLSVRSLFDLYLSSKQFENGSQVVVVPPISVPGMMHVLKYHNLDIVPVDIPEDPRRWLDLKQVEEAITSQTVAIMIVHPFGRLAASAIDMRMIREMADRSGIEIWEDCAECFMGLGKECYRGDPSADVRFFSFGLIKTATALAGGIAVFRDVNARYGVERLQQSLPRGQSIPRFFWRAILAFTLNFIADSQWRVGTLHHCCRLLGINFDGLVTTLLRGFRIKSGDDQRRIQTDLVRQIRFRPSQPLLELVHRRLLQTKAYVAPSVARRIQQCKRMEQIFSENNRGILLPSSPELINTWWSFPIRCGDRDSISKFVFRRAGFDVTSGASQLCSVSQFTDSPCPRANKLMDTILYLPVASQDLQPIDFDRLGCGIQAALGHERGEASSTNDVCDDEVKSLMAQSRLPLLSTAVVAATSVVFVPSVQQLVARSLPFALATFAAIVSMSLFSLYFLYQSTAQLYRQGSSSFALHCDMVEAATCDEPTQEYKGSGNPILSQMDSLRLPKLSETRGHTVILTGATGFIGSMVLRDLLYYRHQLSLGRVILITRGKKTDSASDRIFKLLQKPMFSFLNDSEKKSLIETFQGDVCEKNAGMSMPDLNRIVSDTTISCLFHCAASVGFTQELPEAARANITSALHMHDLTTRIARKGIRFIHISTAFVHGGRQGSSDSPLDEELFPLGDFDAGKIYQSMMGTQFYASKAMSELGFPNTYTLSKCVCEHLLLRQRGLDTIIIRPSIVGPAVESPFEGWAGHKPTTIVAGACLHLLNRWNIWHLQANPVSYVPVDVLSRYVIVKAFSTPKETSDDCETSSSDESFDKLSRWSGDTCWDSVGNSLDFSKESSDANYSSQRIFNATWDVASQSHSFSWLEFSICYLQFGCVLGYFSRLVAYCTLFISAKVAPFCFSDNRTYNNMHELFVRLPIDCVLRILDYLSIPSAGIGKALPFLDLPLLFFPFLRRSHHFRSELISPPGFDARRYVFSITAAAHRFILEKNSNKSFAANATDSRLRAYEVAGKFSTGNDIDLLQAMTNPNGSFTLRLCAWLFNKILKCISSTVSVDLVSFRNAICIQRDTSKPNDTYMILAPTHRSFFDFILLSFVTFAIPELQFDVPFIIAADDFKHLPVLGCIAEKLRAVYIRRGRGQEDPNLKMQLEELKSDHLCNQGALLEVFFEGTRSRDRRFVEPKTGFLKCLQRTGGRNVFVPVTISYERIPEQSILSAEASGTRSRGLNIAAVFSWLGDVWRGRASIGMIHITAGKPLQLEQEENFSAINLVNEVQNRQKANVFVSRYHLEAGSKILGLPFGEVRSAMIKLGSKLWPQGLNSDSDCSRVEDQSELLSIFLQTSHCLAPLFFASHPKWAKWLDHNCASYMPLEEEISNVHAGLGALFDAASSKVSEAKKLLQAKGLEKCGPEHLLQISRFIDEGKTPTILLHAAVQMEIPVVDGEALDCISTQMEHIKVNQDQERLGFWGYSDSGFVMKSHKACGSVTMTGNRYGMSGRSMPKLLPFIESELNLTINPMHEFPELSPIWCREVESNIENEDVSFLKQRFSFSVSTAERIRHGTGHSQEDVFAIRSGQSMRIPDAVVWPHSEEDVIKLVQAAKERCWCLLPFGGGTNVTNATRCPDLSVEPRPIISVDMKQMKKILLVNEEDGVAHIQAGITGRDLVLELSRRGYTMGHEPDSFEFSTLGGWIATKASGMKRSRYGNIEDIVISAKVVTSDGILDKASGNAGRTAEAMDIRSFIVGSEGSLGIVTSAVVRIWPLPEIQSFDSIIFPSFEDGLAFVRTLSRMKNNIPSSVRLLDNAHFRMGQALRAGNDASFFGRAKEALFQVGSSFLLKGFDEGSVVCATIGYEGSALEVANQQKLVNKLASQNAGKRLGAKVGKAGYDLTFLIAYLRDFAMTYHVLGESFETFVPWSKIATVITATIKRIQDEHRARYLPGNPFVGCRVTQLYHEGACLYFYLCIGFEGVQDASKVYAELENAARDEILKHGGSLSHHHGIGKHRAKQLADRISPAFLLTLQKIKNSVDEDNIFGARNGPFASTLEAA